MSLSVGVQREALAQTLVGMEEDVAASRQKKLLKKEKQRATKAAADAEVAAKRKVFAINRHIHLINLWQIL